MKKPNLISLFNDAKTKVDEIEQKIESVVGGAEKNSVLIMDKFCSLSLSGSIYAPLLANDLQNPVVSMIANYFGAGGYLATIVSILNRVAPKLKIISDDKTMFDGAIHHIAAEILVLVKKGEITMDEGIDRIQKLFIPLSDK